VIRAVHAEVIKLVTLPSLGITLGLTWAVVLLLRLADPRGGVVPYAQIGILVLGVLAAGHEYQAGAQIRASLLAVPRRPLLAVAKVIALAVTAAPFVLFTALLAGEPGATGGLLLDLLVAAAAGTVVRHPVGAAGVVLTAYEIGLPLIRTHLPDVAWPSSLIWTAAAISISAATFCRREA
jgi:hypothetical protein